MVRLKSLRGKLAVLCPETDGLQAKHRIRYEQEGKNRVEQESDIIAIETDIFLPFVYKARAILHKNPSRLISFLLSVSNKIARFLVFIVRKCLILFSFCYICEIISKK